ncbi:MAG: phosphoribosyltransferase [archaeon]|nr:phosphoribosyltransferase [archaeon]MCP8305859.1 phosphoribosyltransferase [archaeon]
MNEEKPYFEILDWDTLQGLVKIVAKKVKDSGYEPDIIIGLARGGWAIARLLCDYIDVKDFASLDVRRCEEQGSYEKANLCNFMDLSKRRVLMVDDIDKDVDMEMALEFVISLKPREIRTLALIYIGGSKFKPDYYAKETSRRGIIFPWNFMENMKNMILKTFDDFEVDVQKVKSKLKREFDIDVEDDVLKEVLEELRRRVFVKD